MAGTTPELGLATAQDSDDLEVYLTANPGGLVAVLLILDALFSATTGHAHDAAHKGKPITSAGIASGVTLTSPHLTGPVVDSGGLTVTAGNVGVGGAPNAAIGVQHTATSNLQGFFSGGTLTANANGTSLSGFHANPSLAAGGFTGHTYAAVQIDAQTAPAGFTNNYGVSVGVPSGASGENYAIKAGGVSFIGGAAGGLIVSSNLGVAPVAPASTIALGSGIGTTATAGTNGAPPAQVAGYWFINVAGTIGKVPYYNN